MPSKLPFPRKKHSQCLAPIVYSEPQIILPFPKVAAQSFPAMKLWYFVAREKQSLYIAAAVVSYPQHHYLLWRGVFKISLSWAAETESHVNQIPVFFEKATKIARAVLGTACGIPSQAGGGGRGTAGSAGRAGGDGVLTERAEEPICLLSGLAAVWTSRALYSCSDLRERSLKVEKWKGDRRRKSSFSTSCLCPPDFPSALSLFWMLFPSCRRSPALGLSLSTFIIYSRFTKNTKQIITTSATTQSPVHLPLNKQVGT